MVLGELYTNLAAVFGIEIVSKRDWVSAMMDDLSACRLLKPNLAEAMTMGWMFS